MKRADVLAGAIATIGLLLAMWFGAGRGIYLGRRLLDMPLGTKQAAVVGALGEPDEVRTTFRLAQHRLYEQEYEEAAASSAVEFLVWEYWIDTVCCAGFDKDKALVVRACGGS